jgi:hypothetical protein
MEMKVLDDYSKQIQYNKTTSLLIAAQTWRIFGIAFLWGMIQGLFDAAMAIPDGIRDILIGVPAIPFVIFLWRDYSWSKYALVVWNVLGIAVLVMAVHLLSNQYLGSLQYAKVGKRTGHVRHYC